MERKSISKSMRFEIFKRDEFKCQYCGSFAPDVILEIDHILPVCEGGKNEMINLVTSCFDCNRGKGKRKLSAKASTKAQENEFELLKIRKEQMQQFVKWKKEILSVSDSEFKEMQKLFNTVDREWNELGKKDVLKLLKKYGFKECYESLSICINQYEPKFVSDMLPKVLASRKYVNDNPMMKDVFYIRAIVKNRMYCNEIIAKNLIIEAINNDVNIDYLKELAKTSKNWTQWKNEMEEAISG
jgi:hypothetical protein